MVKGFKEYIKSYLGGFRLGNYDNITPIASLGDVPPKGQGGKDSRGVGLHANKNPRIPKKAGQKDKSDKHSDLYTDEDPRGSIHGLGFTDGAKARQSVSKIRNSGKTHAHKMQAAIAMSQRAKVASRRAKDPEKKNKVMNKIRLLKKLARW